MLTNFRTMTVDRCHNRFWLWEYFLGWYFAGLGWLIGVAEAKSALVVSYSLTRLQLEDVHEGAAVHALAAGNAC
jgi:hypothetical protein